MGNNNDHHQVAFRCFCTCASPSQRRLSQYDLQQNNCVSHFFEMSLRRRRLDESKSESLKKRIRQKAACQIFDKSCKIHFQLNDIGIIRDSISTRAPRPFLIISKPRFLSCCTLKKKCSGIVHFL